MTLTRAAIGKALEGVGISGEQREEAEKAISKALSSAMTPERKTFEPWRYPAYTLPIKK